MRESPENELAQLRAAAARWGSDLDLVQGQGGNVSYKHGGTLYVKGSGTRLANAIHHEIMVSCSLDECRAAFRRHDEAGIVGSMIEGPAGLKPSIETSLHAILKKKFVFHYHCVNAIAATVAGKISTNQPLRDLGAVEVPYRKPGLSLAYAIFEESVSAPCYLLRNHGVILQAESLSELEDNLKRVSKLLDLPPVCEISLQRKLTSQENGWSKYDDSDMVVFGQIVHDHGEMRSETLYPDHAVILGPGIPIDGAAQVGWYVDDNGVTHVRDELRPVLEPMIEALVRVILRLDPDAPRNRLTQEDVAELLDWDAEKERQAMSVTNLATRWNK